MNKITWIIFSVVTVGLLTVLVVFSKSTELDVSKVDVTAVQSANKDNGNIADHVYGKADSKVTLINYGDYQCPGCGYYHPTIKAVVEEYKDKIRFIFRNFPIPSSHPNAKAAAGTAEAAGLQGKFWEMHNKIYESQDSWNTLSGEKRTDFFKDYAKQLGLDVNKFTTDLESENITQKIDFDQALGKKAGVDATPIFYLDGTKLDASLLGDSAKLKAKIDSELVKSEN